jgi:hypothetical protein
MSQVEGSLLWGIGSNHPHSYSIQKVGVPSGRLRSSYLLRNGTKVYLGHPRRKVDGRNPKNWMVQVVAPIELS